MAQAQGLMSGKRGVIVGVANNRSIAWGIAKAIHAQGGEIAFIRGDALKKRVEPLAAELGGMLAGHCDVAMKHRSARFLDNIEDRRQIRLIVTPIFRTRTTYRPLRRHHGGQLRQDDADLRLFLHLGRTSREASTDRRLDADADLLQRQVARTTTCGRRRRRPSASGVVLSSRSRTEEHPRQHDLGRPDQDARLASVSATSATFSSGTNTARRCAIPSPSKKSAMSASTCFRTCRARSRAEILHHADSGFCMLSA